MLEINMEFRRGILFIRLIGVLNKETSKTLTSKIDKMIKEKGIRYFTFNLAGLVQITEEGIDTIRKNYQQILSFDGQLVLCGMHNKGLRTIFNDLYQSSNELGVFKMINI